MEAFRSNVVCPNKHLDADDRLYRGKLLATETYIGGKVEAIESGVFRSDLPCAFKLSPEAFQGLIDRCGPLRRVCVGCAWREVLCPDARRWRFAFRYGFPLARSLSGDTGAGWTRTSRMSSRWSARSSART